MKQYLICTVSVPSPFPVSEFAGKAAHLLLGETVRIGGNLGEITHVRWEDTDGDVDSPL